MRSAAARGPRRSDCNSSIPAYPGRNVTACVRDGSPNGGSPARGASAQPPARPQGETPHPLRNFANDAIIAGCAMTCLIAILIATFLPTACEVREARSCLRGRCTDRLKMVVRRSKAAIYEGVLRHNRCSAVTSTRSLRDISLPKADSVFLSDAV